MLTTLFVLSFLALGVASIHYIGLQNESFEADAGSSRAFWIADGGIQAAKAKIAETPVSWTQQIPPLNGTVNDEIGQASYNATIEKMTNNPRITHRYRCLSTGQVDQSGVMGDQVRDIEARISRISIATVALASGTLSDNCSAGTCFWGPWDQNLGNALTLDAILGKSKAQIQSLAQAAGHYYNSSNYSTGIYQGVSMITSSGPTINFSKDGSGFLLVDCSTSSSSVCFRMNGGIWNGVVWVIGRTQIGGSSGGPRFYGSLFVQGNGDVSSEVEYDDDNIYDALIAIGSPSANSPKIVYWSEEQH